MKTCTRFHFEDVEPGDRLVLGRDGEEPDNTFEVTVRRRFSTKNFGQVVEDTTGEEWYLIDFDIVRAASELNT